MKIQTTVNGNYPYGEAPDFGSIVLVEFFREYGANRFLFKDADKDKLDLLTKSGDGSIAYCSDGGYTLIKHNDNWTEV